MRSLWLIILVLCVSVGACASCKSHEKTTTHVEVTEHKQEWSTSTHGTYSVEGSEGVGLGSVGYGSGRPTSSRTMRRRASRAPVAAEDPATSWEVEIEDTPPLSLVDKVLSSLRIGDLAFSTPESMGLNETASVVLLLSLQDEADKLAAALEDGHVETAEGIKISSEMEAVLVGEGFKITPVAPTKQVVSSFNTTRWVWKLTPKAKGTQELHLSLNARVQVEGKDSPYVVQTFTKRIQVEVTLVGTVKTFLVENWQWLWTTILLPLLLWYFKRRKKTA